MLNSLIKLVNVLVFLCVTAFASGKYDGVNTEPLGQYKYCSPCPSHIPIRDFGEWYVADFLERRGFEVHSAEHNSKHNGIDLVAFGEVFIDDDDFSTPIVLLHEAKSTELVHFGERAFCNKLQLSKSGKQESRTWLNNALAQMEASAFPHIQDLSARIKDIVNQGGLFARTGSLKHEIRDEWGTPLKSHIRFYRITDKYLASHAVDTGRRVLPGPFLSWRLKHLGRYTTPHFSPQGQEMSSFSAQYYLKSVFYPQQPTFVEFF